MAETRLNWSHGTRQERPTPDAPPFWLAFSVWTAGVIVAAGVTMTTGLWATRKVAAYELVLLVGFTIWFWGVLPRLRCVPAATASRIAVGLTIAHALANLLLQTYLVNHALKLERDAGVFLQDLCGRYTELPL